MKDRAVATNRKARYDYDIEESFEAGIELKGPEVKSIRAGRVNLKESFATIDKEELYLYNCHISPYEHTTAFQLDPLRRRRLLVHKREIMRLMGKTSQKGFTLVPLKMYFKKGMCKVELALAKGKKLYDKRRAVKDKEARRELRKVAEFRKNR
ncbi:MAG: SsrA-binding protein SmpB [Candidatus Omnitrophica bacterium]|nr:SsrA-binding protein SmpB [Candidatus Omnitrophota bacterium]